MNTEITNSHVLDDCAKNSVNSLDSSEIYLCDEDKVLQQKACSFVTEVVKGYPAEFDKMYIEPLRKTGEAIQDGVNQANENFKEGLYQIYERILDHYDH